MEVIELEFLVSVNGKIKSRYVYAPTHRNGRPLIDFNRLNKAEKALREAGYNIVDFRGSKIKTLLFTEEANDADAFQAGYNKAINDVIERIKGRKVKAQFPVGDEFNAAFEAGYYKAIDDVMDLLKGNRK